MYKYGNTVVDNRRNCHLIPLGSDTGSRLFFFDFLFNFFFFFLGGSHDSPPLAITDSVRTDAAKVTEKKNKKIQREITGQIGSATQTWRKRR